MQERERQTQGKISHTHTHTTHECCDMLVCLCLCVEVPAYVAITKLHLFHVGIILVSCYYICLSVVLSPHSHAHMIDVM